MWTRATGWDGKAPLEGHASEGHGTLLRLPFIENVEYIDLRRKIIKALVQIRVLLRNLRLIDQINMPKSKLILEVSYDSVSQSFSFVLAADQRTTNDGHLIGPSE